MATRQLGDIRIDRILEEERALFLPQDFFDEATADAMAPHLPWLQPWAITADTGRMVMPVQSYLVRTRHHTILIDTCIGCRKSEAGVPEWADMRNETWLKNLKRAGVAPEEIDFVFCTHLHLDHCGWNTRLVDGRWMPTFPNAKYILARDEVAASEAEDGPVFRENVLPVLEAKQAVLVDLDHALDDEVWIEPLIGHTVGHYGVNLKSNGRHAAMCGDMLHNTVQLAEVAWSPNFDGDPVQSRATRRRFLETHCETDTLILTAHLPSPSVGRIVPRQGAFDLAYDDPL
jgi:glyoxylase-like metal-dependent hydrolase (beta-lactamase superfamily II)